MKLNINSQECSLIAEHGRDYRILTELRKAFSMGQQSFIEDKKKDSVSLQAIEQARSCYELMAKQ